MTTLLQFTVESYSEGILTRSSATAEGPHNALNQLKSCLPLYNYMQITLAKLAIKVMHSHQKWRYLIGHTSLHISGL